MEFMFPSTPRTVAPPSGTIACPFKLSNHTLSAGTKRRFLRQLYSQDPSIARKVERGRRHAFSFTGLPAGTPCPLVVPEKSDLCVSSDDSPVVISEGKSPGYTENDRHQSSSIEFERGETDSNLVDSGF